MTNVPVAEAFIGELLKGLGSLNAPTAQSPHSYFPQCPETRSELHQTLNPNYGESKKPLTGREQSQAKQFVKFDPTRTLDYDKGYQEVLRRTKDYSNFNCSKERVISLCSENNDATTKGIREAITGLELEAQGKIFNLRRGPEQVDIGSDFLAEDINGVTRRIEIKNPVGSAIKAAEGDDSSVEKQGISIGKKHIKQVDKWEKLGKIKGPHEVLTVMDLYDVPVAEKAAMQAAIRAGLNEGVQKIGPLMPETIFINDIKNI